MELLQGSSLNRLYLQAGPRSIFHGSEYTLWVAGYYRTLRTNICFAENLTTQPFDGRHLRNCTDKLPFVCVRNKTGTITSPAQSGESHCEDVVKTASSRPRKCLNRRALTFQQSAEACEALGMYLLPEGLQNLDYEELTDEGERTTHHDGERRYWLHPLRNYSGWCVALEHDNCAEENSTFLQKRTNCSENMPSTCIYPPAIFPLPAPNEAPCEETRGWLTSGKDITAAESTNPGTVGTLSSDCGNDSVSSDDSALFCPSSKLREKWEALETTSQIEEISKRLNTLGNEVVSPGDIETMCHHVQQVVKRFDGLAEILSDAEKEKENQKLAQVLVRFASNVMMTNLWRCFPEKERLDLAAQLYIMVERFATRTSRG